MWDFMYVSAIAVRFQELLEGSGKLFNIKSHNIPVCGSGVVKFGRTDTV
jgi:hypothetical protein